MVGVELTLARAADSKVVGEAQVLHHGDGVIERGGGYECIVVDGEVAVVVVLVFHVLLGVFVADAAAYAEFRGELGGYLSVECADVVVVGGIHGLVVQEGEYAAVVEVCEAVRLFGTEDVLAASLHGEDA